jgi:predicted amino acid dehydrogenase
MVLCARNAERLQMLAEELRCKGVVVDVADNLRLLPGRADVVICAASLASPSLLLEGVAPDAIVCDAGYPKNLAPEFVGETVFFGGLGQIAAGMTVRPDIYGALHLHPYPNVLHGCLLEGITLALERRFEPFSRGRGLITSERVSEIESMAERHGIHLAPLSNAAGPVGHSAVYAEQAGRR